MENHIVIESSSKIREIARHALSGYWKPVVLGILIYYILTTGVTSVLDYLFSYNYPVELYEGHVVQESIGFGGSIYSLILGGPLQLGITYFLLVFFRTRKCDNTLIFEGFSNFSKSFVLAILMGIKVLLWSMLFIIPGIIASFRYSLAFYIMADNPTWTPGQCIKESCRLMQGNKAKLFSLQLSFFGWYLLALIPGGILAAFSSSPGLIGMILAIIIAIPEVVVDAYSLTATTAFYEMTAGRLVVAESVDAVTEIPQPSEPEVTETQKETAPEDDINL